MARTSSSKARAKPSPAAPRKDGSRAEAVLETALSLFSQRSYAEVTMQEIARSVGITHSLIYYYYESKEQLFHAAVQHAIDNAMQRYGHIKDQHQHPVELIHDWLDTNIELAGQLRKLVRIMFEYSDKHRSSPSMEKSIRRFYRHEQKVISDGIRAGIDMGLFKCEDPDKMARFVSANLDGIFYGTIVRRDVKIKSAVSELKKVLWRLLEYDDTP